MKLRYHKVCFVPTCGSSYRTTPEKSFFFVRDKLKKKWCNELDIVYDPKDCYCCENHLNLQEDLENYTYWKLMKGRPILKPTAKLIIDGCTSRTTQDIPADGSCNEQEPSMLQTLLTSYNLPQVQKKKLSAKVPLRSDHTINVAVQCKAQTEEKSTNTDGVVSSRICSIQTTKPIKILTVKRINDLGSLDDVVVTETLNTNSTKPMKILSVKRINELASLDDVVVSETLNANSTKPMKILSVKRINELDFGKYQASLKIRRKV